MQSDASRRSRVRVLWIAPKLNHYRAGLLRRLSSELEFTRVVAGEVESKAGAGEAASDDAMFVERLGCTKSSLAWRMATYRRLRALLRQDKVGTVVMPLEKKFLLLILFLFLLRTVYGYQLVTYNHPVFWKGKLHAARLSVVLQRILFSFYDKVIFYTEQSRDDVVELGLIASSKAFFANNTLGTEPVREPRPRAPSADWPANLLFVGKLDPRKRVDLLFEIFGAVREFIPGVSLTIVGDGPDRHLVQEQTAKRKDVSWAGGVSDEDRIASYMEKAHLVLVPGDSGLSIVHAFRYARPYATLEGLPGHGPELSYLKDGVNGMLLGKDVKASAARIAELLGDSQAYEEMCRGAHKTGVHLSAENWCEQIVRSIEA